MSKRKNKLMGALLLACAVASVSAWRGAFAAAVTVTDLPVGKGVEVARAKCLSCHEADLIVAQKLSRAGWVREVEKMMRWGAPVNAEEKETLVDYFAAHFAPRPVVIISSSSANSLTRGQEIYVAKCLTCHEADLIKQQRLARVGWSREVDKMVRWGAQVSAEEKEPLVDYLFQHYGTRPLAVTR